MLYDLLHYDLGDWHPRRIVRISALAKQHLGAPLADTLGGQWQSPQVMRLLDRLGL
jgi:hypothetical protein